MDIQTRKIEFIQEFLKIQREDVISRLEKLLRKETQPEEDDAFAPMTMEELNERIDQSEKDFENKRYKTTSQLLSKY